MRTRKNAPVGTSIVGSYFGAPDGTSWMKVVQLGTDPAGAHDLLARFKSGGINAPLDQPIPFPVGMHYSGPLVTAPWTEAAARLKEIMAHRGIPVPTSIACAAVPFKSADKPTRLELVVEVPESLWDASISAAANIDLALLGNEYVWWPRWVESMIVRLEHDGKPTDEPMHSFLRSAIHIGCSVVRYASWGVFENWPDRHRDEMHVIRELSDLAPDIIFDADRKGLARLYVPTPAEANTV